MAQVLVGTLLLVLIFLALGSSVDDDDFCDDTRNGSDESFSSACSGYVGNSAVTCKDKRFVSMKVFSSRLNDGVCDCCDGSDEKNGVCGANTCESVGISLKESKRSYAEDRIRGLESKRAIAEKTANRFVEMQEAVHRESKEGLILDQSIRVLEAQLLEKEKLEAADTQRVADESKMIFERAVELLAGAMSKETVTDWIAALTVRCKEDSTESITNSLPERGALGDASEAMIIALEAPSAKDGDIRVKEGGSEELYMNIDGVPVVGPASYVLGKMKLSDTVMQDMKEALALTPAFEQSVFVNTLAAAIQEAQVMEVLMLGALDANAFPDLSISQLRTTLTSIPDSPLFVKKRHLKSDSGNALRQDLQTAKNEREELKGLADNAKALQAGAGADLGPNSIFLHFYDKCFRNRHGGYQYSACPFKEAYQSNVLLGRYSGIEIRATQRGGGVGKQMLELSDKLKEELGLPTEAAASGDVNAGAGEMWMVFKEGTFCHAAGRGRQMHVRLECSAEESDELTNILEPETCFYMATLRTPVAC